MRRKITLAFLILAAFLLQTTVFQYFQIASVTPNLLLILTSAFGLMRGKKEGLMVGFFSGLMIDLFYGSLFGFYALLYMYIGYLNGFFCKRKRNFCICNMCQCVLSSRNSCPEKRV